MPESPESKTKHKHPFQTILKWLEIVGPLAAAIYAVGQLEVYKYRLDQVEIRVVENEEKISEIAGNLNVTELYYKVVGFEGRLDRVERSLDRQIDDNLDIHRTLDKLILLRDQTIR